MTHSKTDPDVLRWTMMDIKLIQLREQLKDIPSVRQMERNKIELLILELEDEAAMLMTSIVKNFENNPARTEPHAPLNQKASRVLPELILPWPDPRLSPNARVHWSSKAKAASRAREMAGFSAIAQGWGAKRITNLPPDIHLHLWIDFFPPNRRHRDDDNLLSSFKPYRDGLSDALGINDMRFISHPLVHDTPTKGGQVKVRLTLPPLPGSPS